MAEMARIKLQNLDFAIFLLQESVFSFSKAFLGRILW
jgi:hypothetical protein